MIWVRSIREGFLGGRGKALAAALLFGSSWLFATLALRPMSVGLHAALDGAPAARDLLSGAGLDLLGETALRQPALWAGGFSLFLPMLLLYALAGLYLTAGIYGQAALPGVPVWRTFFERARRFFAPFALGLLMNLLFWGIVTGLFVLGMAGLWHGFKGATDPGTQWKLFLIDAAIIAVLVNLFRGSAGFFQARYALAEGRVGLGRCFLDSLSFTLRRFLPVNGLTWLFSALHVLVLWLAVFALSPGYASTGLWIATALILQAGYFALAFLRVAEAQTQVAYARSFIPVRTPIESPAPKVDLAARSLPGNPQEGDSTVVCPSAS